MTHLPSRPAPRATVLVAILNNQAYVGAMLRSLLSQWRPDFELLLVDDASTDDSFEVARQAIAAHPDVSATLLRNASTQGMAQIPRLLRHANAPVLIQADSDDIALPGRLDAIMACFDADPRCRLVTSNAVLLSETGLPIGILDTAHPDEVVDDPAQPAGRVGSLQWLGATSAYHRALLETFPPFDPELCPYGIDLVLAFRAALLGTHHYLARPYVGWRQHARNSHKLVGANSGRDVGTEQHGALELMALAQRLRDLDALRAGHPDPASLDALAAICHRTFLGHFEFWSRVRNRVAASARSGVAASLAAKPAPSLAAVPPVVQLQHGVRRRFGLGEALWAVAEDWDGFHRPEAAWNWTARTALLTFGISDPRSRVLMLGVMRGVVVPTARRLQVSIDFGPPQEFDITGEEGTMLLRLELPGPGGRPLDMPTHTACVLLHVPGAESPLNIGLGSDVRVLGARMLFVEAEARVDAPPDRSSPDSVPRRADPCCQAPPTA